MDTFVAFLMAVAVTAFFTRGYHRAARTREHRARQAAAKGELRSDGPRSQHPHIDVSQCIGCGGCAGVCPEGEVLDLLGGKAAILHGYKCIGHGLCAEACPVGAITMVMASPSMAADLPFLTAEHETSLPNVFIAGELGGLALIKNAVNQGRLCVDTIARRRAAAAGLVDPDVYDVVIVGAGPAGISASLRAIQHELRYVTLERDEVGGAVAKYPRQKLVMTSPVELPIYGRFSKTEVTKEELLALWHKVMTRSDAAIRTGEAVESLSSDGNGIVTVTTSSRAYRAHAAILAVGRSGTPRKLGVPGEELPKVMYRLIDANHYVGKRVLVVGGGDSAVEAAMGLAHQPGNQVTLSYRQERFGRIKERNAERLQACVRAGKIRLMLPSTPVRFTPEAAVLEVAGSHHEIGNDFVWIFAGGVPPNDFLKKIGVALGTRDLTAEAGQEARRPSPPPRPGEMRVAEGPLGSVR